MKMKLWLIPALAAAMPAWAQEAVDSLYEELDEVVVTTPKGVRKLRGASNSEIISASELKRLSLIHI